MERQPISALMFADTSTTLPQTLDRTWRPCCMACSNTGLKPPGFLLEGASEKHCVRWACFWCLDPSTACPRSLSRYSDTARDRRTTCARVHCIPWRPLPTSVMTWMRFRPCTVCQGSGYACHLAWKLFTFMLHFQSGINPWSLSVELKTNMLGQSAKGNAVSIYIYVEGWLKYIFNL